MDKEYIVNKETSLLCGCVAGKWTILHSGSSPLWRCLAVDFPEPENYLLNELSTIIVIIYSSSILYSKSNALCNLLNHKNYELNH